ncbi:alanine acetyltransferase [Sphaerisporangium rufum]|uniref:Alanine acetyltransferase n=1 Tax=Sphaerisporangium rufum TaxID=1381558 RepID=A0A919V4G1_9ACTN|nr:alanine acetyltransferase [Sphaerisporangium rufum]
MALRPVREDDLATIEDLQVNPERTGEFAWFGWRDVRAWRRRWEENGLLHPEQGTLMVVRAAESLGFVTWRTIHRTTASTNLSIGIGMLPEARGHGYGTQAHRLIARYLFAHTLVHRIEADTEVENIAEQRALEKAGFVREGVTRSCAWRDGAWRDGVTYSLLRTDPPV